MKKLSINGYSLKKQGIHKFLLVMKLTLMLTLFFALNAASAVYSQKTHLTLNLKSVTLEKAFDAIEKETGYSFFYHLDRIDLEKKITIHVTDESLMEVLDKILDPERVEYRIIDNSIIIMQAQKVLQAKLQQQNGFVVTGKVIEKNGDPIAGVNVYNKNNPSKGVITSADGRYTITVDNPDAILVFSFIGFETQEIHVAGRKEINVTLTEKVTTLDEIITTALSIGKAKRSLGYAIEEIKENQLNNTPQENVLNSLSGKVAGVTISQMDGLAGSSVNMIIRGAISLNNDNQPLFVIDGVPVSNSLNNFYKGADMGNAISDLNSNDIASISVLKGPSAAALYGSRAGNGVVLITTKSGKSMKKGIGVNFNSAVTFDDPYKYIMYQTKFGPGKAGVHAFEESENENWGPRLDAGVMAVQWNTNGQPAPLVSYDNRLTDFYRTGYTFTNNLSVNGNNEHGDFRISVGDMRNTAIIPNTDLKRKSINFNGSYNITKKFKVQASIGITETGSDNRPVIDGGRNTVVRSVYEMSAHVNILDLRDYWVPGMEYIQQLKYKHKQNNPWFLAYENTISFLRDRTVSKVQFDWEVLNGLKITGRYARDSYSEGREAKKAFSTYGQWDGGYNIQSLYRKETNLDLMITYNKNFNDTWDLNALLGTNNMYQYGRIMNNEARSLVIPNLYTISNGVPGTVLYNSSWYEKTIYGLYGQASLGYRNMIFLDLTARNDWSSTLPKDNRSYFYPSASMSIVLSEIFSMPKWIDFAKLRGGIAQVGHDVGPYQLNQYYSTAADWGNAKRMYMGGTLKNANLKPEIATSKEVGMDFRLLNSRMRMGVTYYVLDNENQVLNIGLPIESGASSKQINAGLVSNKGWEFSFQTTPVMTHNFRWDMNISVTRDRTKIKELAEGIKYFEFVREGSAIVRTYVGETIGDIYQKPMLRVTDKNSPYYGYPIISNGGIIQRDNDPDHLEKVGNFNHDFIMGIQPVFTFKSISLYANIDWRQGGEFFSRTMTFLRNNGQLDNTFSGTPYDPDEDIVEQIKEDPDKYFGYWVGGRTGDLGGFSWPDPNNGREQDACFHPGVREEVDSNGNIIYVENLGGPGTIWLTPFIANKKIVRTLASPDIYSATYVKLRELALTYNLPKNFTNKLRMQNVSISVIAKNIFEWTKAGVNFDPERAFKGGSRWSQGVEYYNALPWIASYGFKLNVQF